MRTNKALLNLRFRKQSEEGMYQSFTVPRFGSIKGRSDERREEGLKAEGVGASV